MGGGGGMIWDMRWRQAESELQLKATLKDSLEAEWERRRQEFSRHGGGKRREEES